MKLKFPEQTSDPLSISSSSSICSSCWTTLFSETGAGCSGITAFSPVAFVTLPTQTELSEQNVTCHFRLKQRTELQVKRFDFWFCDELDEI